MPARKTLSDFENTLGKTIEGVDRLEFDRSNAKDYLKVTCQTPECKKVFESSRANLCARFNRKNIILCWDCNASINSKQRFKDNNEENTDRAQK